MSLIGDEIKRERRLAGMTSKRLAELTVRTPQYIRLIECGGAIPSMETVLKIANEFPDADTGRWLWLLLRDQWGDPVFDVMWRHALTTTSASTEEATGR